MDDLSADITASTALDDTSSPAASGAGTPRTLEEPQSLRDTLTASMKEQTAALDKEAEKPEPDAKVEEKPDTKAEEAKPDEKTDKESPKAAKPEDEKPAEKVDPPKEEQRQEKDDRKPRHPEPPQRFLPRAKELWPNVPNEVKGEVARLVSEHEGEIKQAREFITPLVKYHQMATQAGTTIHDALDRYVNMETALRQNPAEGFKALLSNMQMQPQQAIGHIIKAFGVAPQQLAQHIAQNERAYVAPDVQQQQPREDPRISQLQEQLAEERAERMRASIIEPFKANHPRYDELEQDIAFFLSSGKIPSNLSHAERLEAAYDMAARINPASNVHPAQTRDGPVTEARAVSDLGGTKSIKSAPGSVTPDMEPDRGGSIRDTLTAELRRRKIA